MSDIRRAAILSAVLLLCPWLSGLACAGGGAPELFHADTVRKGHPRLILLDQDLPALCEAVAGNPLLAAWYNVVRESAAQLLNAPLVSYPYDARNNMLEPCRQAVDRIYRLGLVYRLEGDRRFAARAVEEMLNAARLDNWDPAHFLDTAELTHAVAIGYDWLYPVLTSDQRAVICEALCRKGLEEGLYFYGVRLPVTFRYQDFNWAVCNHNWSQVCNGGMTMGALAVAEDAPQLAEQVLSAALQSIRRPMAEYAPDGGWVEGPGYWEYATSYNVYFLAALETAIGPAAIEPYLRMPGFDKTGEFRVQMVGPLNLTFNFADSREPATRSAEMFWLARKFHRPVYAWHAAQFAAPSPFDILWYDPEQKSPKQVGLPLDAYFRYVETVFLRSAWDDPNAVWVGFKGGSNRVNHGHLDLGAFVLDANGQRWALDLGRDSYTLPGYFVFGKAVYYRLNTQGHNTLIVDGANQWADAAAPIVAFRSQPEKAYAVADLSEAYSMTPGRVRRGIALLRRRDVLVQDEMRLAKPAKVVWQMHTRATADIRGANTVLRQAGKTLTATILEPPGAVFEVAPADPPPPQAQQPDVRKLLVRLSLPAGEARLAVLFSSGDQAAVPDLTSLATWIAEAAPPVGH